MKERKIVWLIGALSISVFGGGFSWMESVPVRRSVPVYRSETIKTPYQACWNQRVPIHRNYAGEPAAALLGGVVGGVVGHQFGRGHGRDAATIGGAALGALVGANLAETNQAVQYRVRRICETRYREHRERRLLHYKNIAWYRGHKIVTFSRSPLKWIDLHVQVSY
ncbi:glycine zipper 2TM domain-containing protein [Nitratifractor sp.]|uniref:glycine zipper 2TM domain-containing protein n=1 Tax=Nitratifractor sp. TaxID=2268144 RepID=UPI0025E51114|nr:glycine zipper 2TM domain-containing protein [Nitratifractor sp.]